MHRASRWIRLVFSVSLFVGSSFVMFGNSGTPVLAEQDNCGKVVPMDAILGDGATVKTLATGGLTSVPVTGTGGVVVAGGGAAVVGAAGNALMGAALFLGTVDTTCRFLDWTGWNGCDFVVQDWCGEKPQPLQTQANSSQSTSQPCADLFVTGPSPDSHCRIISFETARPAYMTWITTRVTSWCYSTVCIPQQAFSSQYVGNTSTTYGTAAGSGWRWLCSNGVTWNEAKTQSCVAGSIGAQLVLAYRCVGNVGGMCGQHPSEIVLEAGQSRSGNPTTVLNVWREDAPNGWSRRLVTDVRCGASLGWVRAITPDYFDKLVNQRVEVPTCGPNAAPTAIRTINVPTGVTLPAAGTTTGLNLKWIVHEWFAPTSWTTGTPPEYLQCFTGGVDCGVPSLDSQTGTCTWGGGAVPASFCDPTRQTKTDPTVQNAPKPVGELATPVVFDPARAGTTYAAPTTADPGGGTGGTGTGTTTAIDDGTGPCGGVAGCGQTPDLSTLGTNAECWPAGWGWFNPAQWVLKPIMCALGWAFVPKGTQIQDSWAGLTTAAYEHVPLSWIVEGLQLARDLVDGTGSAVAANSTECLHWIDQFRPGHPEGVCISGAVSGGFWATSRLWMARFVWFFFGLWVLSEANSIVEGHRTPKTESFYVG